MLTVPCQFIGTYCDLAHLDPLRAVLEGKDFSRLADYSWLKQGIK